MLTTVTPANGHYLVTRVDADGVRVYIVTKKGSCSCRHKKCEHIKTVRKYLEDGGQKAPEHSELTPRVDKCPICTAETRRDRAWPAHWWRCTRDRTHYFRWRGEVGGVREWLTGNFDDGREAWLRSLESSQYSLS